ncbi:enoyl-CoA hydratase/isomerase family protein [Halopenitus salinus]|uniref:Enoyl-CoA hydratase/isomerase family protein n=1 Tax=Halopenitus salinus TaxID=1198295 RepID=A0ABD5UYP4_9EURY
MVSYDAYESITVDVADGVATIEFHRPEVYNALSTEVYLDLSRALSEIQLNRDIDVVVLTGEGEDAFSSGADIEQYAGPAEEHDPREKDRQRMAFEEVYKRIYEIHPVTIAKINGYCVGGGLVLASFCDLRVAVDDAKFGVPTTDIGQIPGGGSTYRMVQLVGEPKTKEIVYTAGLIDAAEAHDIGLVNRVVPREDLDDEVDGIVDAIQDTGRGAVKASKQAINHSANAPDLETAHEHESEIWWEQFATEERRRLVDEFNEG